MASSSDTCPICGHSIAGGGACSNCGYNPAAIASGGTSIAAPGRRSTRSLRFVVVAVLVIGLSGGAGFWVARYKRDAIRSLGAGIGLNHAIGPDLSPAECEERMNHYLSGLFAATEGTSAATDVATVQNQASEEFGVGSKEWKGLLDVYTSYAGIAATESPRKALRKSAPEVERICSDGD